MAKSARAEGSSLRMESDDRSQSLDRGSSHHESSLDHESSQAAGGSEDASPSRRSLGAPPLKKQGSVSARLASMLGRGETTDRPSDGSSTGRMSFKSVGNMLRVISR